jgi:hypothetical protein
MTRWPTNTLAPRLLLVLCTLSTVACTPMTPVQPWEKGVLAGREMQFDRDALDKKFVEHTYTSKEAASKGGAVGGGGCGCN